MTPKNGFELANMLKKYADVPCANIEEGEAQLIVQVMPSVLIKEPNSPEQWKAEAIALLEALADNVLGGVDQAIPVTAYIPGCPPKPSAITYGAYKLLEALSEILGVTPKELAPDFEEPPISEHIQEEEAVEV